MKNLIKYTLVVFIVVIVSILFLPLSPKQNISFKKIEKLKLKYAHSYLYTSRCDANDISEIAVYYKMKGDIVECKEWIDRCNKCRIKHIDIKNLNLLNSEKFCANMQENDQR